MLFNASDYTHYGHDRLFLAFPPGNPDALAEWILVGPIALCEFFIDDDRVESGAPIITGRGAPQVLSVVLFGEITSLKKRNAHGLKVIGRNEVKLQRGLKMRR